eukprot:1832012-Prorocentrum_lima.AAC.1
MRQAGIAARTQRYHPCRGWLRGEASGVTGAMPGSHAARHDARTLGKIALSLSAHTLQLLQELHLP